MSAAPFALAAVFTFAACAAEAADLPAELPHGRIDACLSRLGELAATEDRPASHAYNIKKHCPELAAGLASSFDTGDRGSLNIDVVSIEGLRDLRTYAAGFESSQATSVVFSPNYESLDALLAEILVEERIDDSLFDRFVHWLESHFRDGESPKLEKFFDWLTDLDAPPWLGELILKTSIVLIVLLALMVVGNELRLAGVMRRIRRPRDRPMRGEKAKPATRVRRLSFEELRDLPPRRMAAAALELVTESFAERGWLSSSASLTNGERVAQIAEGHGELAGRFSDIVRAIEEVVYGDRPPGEEARNWLLESAGDLIARARGSSGRQGSKSDE